MNKFITMMFGVCLLAGCSQNVSDTGPTQVSDTLGSNPTSSPSSSITITQKSLSITLQAGNHAQLQWSSSSPAPAYYDLLVNGGNGFSNSIRLAGTVVSYVDSNLTANVTYQYQLNGYDQQGNLVNAYQNTARINVFSTVASDTVL